MFVSVVSVLYRNSVFRCFDLTETKQKQPKQTEKIRLLCGSGTASGFVNKIHGSGSQGLKNLRIGGSRSRSGRRQFKGTVHEILQYVFLVSFDRYDVPTPMELVLLLLKFRFRVEFFDFCVSAW
jgi:hypothetical protein